MPRIEKQNDALGYVGELFLEIDVEACYRQAMESPEVLQPRRGRIHIEVDELCQGLRRDRDDNVAAHRFIMRACDVHVRSQVDGGRYVQFRHVESRYRTVLQVQLFNPAQKAYPQSRAQAFLLRLANPVLQMLLEQSKQELLRVAFQQPHHRRRLAYRHFLKMLIRARVAQKAGAGKGPR